MGVVIAIIGIILSLAAGSGNKTSQSALEVTAVEQEQQSSVEEKAGACAEKGEETADAASSEPCVKG
ncbi:MAG: hypothetical protein HY538_00105 [Deltaproteobacteria bacterium]|nr:hypothetical protein [Deltaproteobacteria bacterium]